MVMHLGTGSVHDGGDFLPRPWYPTVCQYSQSVQRLNLKNRVFRYKIYQPGETNADIVLQQNASFGL